VAIEHWKPRRDGCCVAQICRNGHVITDAALRAQDLPPFCAACGGETFVKCSECGEPIRGEFPPGDSRRASSPPFVRPNYCAACGSPYPWTAAQRETARELAARLEGLSGAERHALQAILDDLITDALRAPVAALEFNTLLCKARGPSARPLRDLVARLPTGAREYIETT